TWATVGSESPAEIAVDPPGGQATASGAATPMHNAAVPMISATRTTLFDLTVRHSFGSCQNRPAPERRPTSKAMSRPGSPRPARALSTGTDVAVVPAHSWHTAGTFRTLLLCRDNPQRGRGGGP